MTSASYQSNSLAGQFRRRAYWITIAAYILLNIGVRYFVFSPLFQTFVEDNQEGLFKGYFSNLAGYGVVEAVVQKVWVDIFIVQQLLAIASAIILWRKHKPVAMGILSVILAFVIYALCVLSVFILFARRGY